MKESADEIYEIQRLMKSVETRLRHNSEANLFKLRQSMRYLEQFYNEFVNSDEFAKALNPSRE